MGYDVKRFSDLGVLAEDITCPICMNVFRDPVTTKCRHTYCRECICEWLARHQTCPLDQSPICPHGELTKPPIFVINILGRLMISCDFKEKGCQSTIKLEDLSKHVALCPFRPKSAVTQVFSNLSKFSNRLALPNFTSWLNRVNQRLNSEHPPTPPARIRARPRHTELARQREQRDESEREEDLTSFLIIFLVLLAAAVYFGILFRFLIDLFLIFLFDHISIVFFVVFIAIVDLVPQPNMVRTVYSGLSFDEMLP